MAAKKKAFEKKSSISASIEITSPVAKVVLMPGDPLRAKYVADHYLKDVKCFNKVRNMVDSASAFIEAGRLQLFCVDSNDKNSWSSTNPDGRWRIEQQEAYFHYIVDEVCPRIFEISTEANGSRPDGILTTGCSMPLCVKNTFAFDKISS